MGKKHTKPKNVNAPPTSTITELLQSSNVYKAEDILLVWLDANIDEADSRDSSSTITKLTEVVTNIRTFRNADTCLSFITDLKDKKTFVICSGALGQTIVPVIHDMTYISAVYIFCRNIALHEQWSKQWSKVKGVFTDISSICEAIKYDAQENDENDILMSFITSTEGNINQTLDQLDPSFMYTQILKEILLTIDFDEQHFSTFISYCRKLFDGDDKELQNIEKAEREYHEHSPIWWYTCNGFLYKMVNRALHTMDVDLIVNMGFFIRDLHNDIVDLHAKQYIEESHSKTLTVYRGQGLPREIFDRLMKTKGGLLSFNNFVSTSTARPVALKFASKKISSLDQIAILYIMNINSSLSSTPYVNVKDISYYPGEEEILFSMHSIFRIGAVKQTTEDDRIWEVELILTSDNDPQLYALTEHIRQEIFPQEKGWYRLTYLLIKLGHYDKAQQVCEIMLDQTSDDRENANIYDQLAWIKDHQKQYAEALTFYELSNGILQKILPSKHVDLATSYNNIGLMYDKVGEHSKALSAHKKALEIYQTLSANHPDLATCYASHGSVYQKLGEYSKALSFYEKTLEIRKQTLPTNDPDLAISYCYMGNVHDQMGNYLKALSYHTQALNIGKLSLPPDHPKLQIYKANVERLKTNL